MPNLDFRKLRRTKRRTVPGAPPGTLVLPAGAHAPKLSIISYADGCFEERALAGLSELRACLDRASGVTWVQVKGLGDESLLRQLGEIFKIHPLALEDIVHTPQSPKTDDYEHHKLILARMVMMVSKDNMEAEQLSLLLGKNYVLSYTGNGWDCLEPVRERLRHAGGLLRKQGPDYLAYALLDAVIDNYFPVLESYGEYLEELEYRTVREPLRNTLAQIHAAKRELLDLRRVIWPQRETLNQLIRDESPFISRDVRMYLRDCYDHSVQVMDMVETYREITSGLHDVYLSSIGNRTNEIMKVLTIISTIFIPLTFMAGVYGMNFQPESSPWNMPEVRMRYGYPVLLLAMLAVAAALVAFFWRKGWIFSGNAAPDAQQASKRDAKHEH